jgi:hypothetical protein
MHVVLTQVLRDLLRALVFRQTAMLIKLSTFSKSLKAKMEHLQNRSSKAECCGRIHFERWSTPVRGGYQECMMYLRSKRRGYIMKGMD